MLLFRGEPRVYSTPSISSLLRTHWSGSSYAEGKDAQGLLDQLKADLQIVRPIYSGPDEGDSFLLQRKKDGKVEADRWIYDFSDDEQGGGGSAPSETIVLTPEKKGRFHEEEMTLMQLLFKFHVQYS